ncbi:MAG: GHKL domain-containing protein [Desulfobacteraceae bacterium]|nr:GHKL domain-containing protein [Desulfobacteraceae bacterium]MCB9494178.1 GHKL domain-containing protein [Desulfobacteraceae bacterium]
MESELTQYKPGKLTFFKNASAAAFTLLLSLFMGMTITFQYTTYRELNKTKDLQSQKELEKTAVALNYFLAERKNDLNELISSRYLTAYYENKALGMSLKYGLQTSLSAIKDRFLWLIAKKDFNKSPIYSRIQLTNKEGDCIIDTNEKNIEQKNKCLLKKVIFAERSIVSFENFFIMKTPVFFKGEFRGDIYAWLKKDLIEKNFLASFHNPGSATILFYANGEVAVASEKNYELFSILKENLHLFKANLSKPDFQGLKMKIFKRGLIKFFGAKLSDSDFYLVQIIPEKHFKEQSPALIIFSMLILLTGAVLGLFFWWRLNSKNIGLKVKVDEEITRQKIIRQKNNQLQNEIFKRKTAEKNLYEYNRNLESIILEKTQNLESTVRRLKTAQSQLVQSEKMASIGQLSAGIAHEINNPLGFIKTNFSTLQQYAQEIIKLLRYYEKLESAKAEKFEDYIKKIHTLKKEMDFEFIKNDIQCIFDETKEGIDRILSIIADLKFFAHRETTEKIPVDIHQCIDSTLNVIHNEIKYKANIVKEYGKLPKIRCYPQRINQILTNLIINSAQAIQKTGTITIRTFIENNYCVIKISDTGDGIPANIRDKIFDPFFSTKPVGQGTGLGLHVVYDLVKKHSGKIKLESEEKKGTSFFIYLPLEKDE